jgi:FlaA1/EpsC-like NDP-sugar epimerase
VTAVERALLADEVFFGEVQSEVPRPVTAPSAGLRRRLIALDAVAAVAGWAAGLAVTRGVEAPTSSSPIAMSVLVIAVLAATTILLITGQRLYLARVCSIRAVEIGRLWRAAAFAGAAALLLPRLTPVGVSVPGAVVGAGATFFTLIASRGLYRHWLQAGRRDGRYLREMVIVGSNEEAYDLCKLIADHPELGFRVAGVVGDRTEVLSLGPSRRRRSCCSRRASTASSSPRAPSRRAR